MPKGGIVGMFTGRVCLSLMERTEGGAEGEKAQEEERQWTLDHQSRIPDKRWIILSGRTG
jgi:hypothetical protein